MSDKLVMGDYVAVAPIPVIPGGGMAGVRLKSRPQAGKCEAKKRRGAPWRQRPFAGVVPSCQ